MRFHKLTLGRSRTSKGAAGTTNEPTALIESSAESPHYVPRADQTGGAGSVKHSNGLGLSVYLGHNERRPG